MMATIYTIPVPLYDLVTIFYKNECKLEIKMQRGTEYNNKVVCW